MKEFTPRPIELIDTTLRDGAQSPLFDDYKKYKFSIPNERKILGELADFGVSYFETFSPRVYEGDHRHLRALIKKRDQLRKNGIPVFILAHVRCLEEDVFPAVEEGVDGLNFYIGVSEISRSANHKKDLHTIIATAKPILQKVRREYPDLTIRFSGEDAFRTSEDDLKRVYDEIVPFVDRLGTPDTVGIARPKEVKYRVAWLLDRYKRELEGHFHNDRGLSMANALAAIEAGMQKINTSVLGLAERSGITSMTGLILNLGEDKSHPERVVRYKLERAYPINITVAQIIGMQVPWTEPVSLTNRTHSAGVHTNAVHKDSRSYEGVDLALYGVDKNKLLLGHLSGRNIVQYYLEHILHFLEVTSKVVDQIVPDFKREVHSSHKSLSPEVILRRVAKRHGLHQDREAIRRSTHLEHLDNS